MHADHTDWSQFEQRVVIKPRLVDATNEAVELEASGWSRCASTLTPVWNHRHSAFVVVMKRRKGAAR